MKVDGVSEDSSKERLDIVVLICGLEVAVVVLVSMEVSSVVSPTLFCL